VPVYLDNAATTRVAPSVAEAMLACMRDDFGNPSSAHRLGIAAARRIEAARAALLAALGDERGRAGEIVWTSGGTEADALGVGGAARARAGRGRHLVCSAIEHPAVLGTAQSLAGEGFRATLVPVARSGAVAPEAIAEAVGDDTCVVACMLVNNELGTIQPVAELVRAVRARRPDVHIHCDAVQALGKIPVDVVALGADSVAVSAHKLHGPKGAGALWLRKGARVTPLWSGGGQQQGLRSGTENVPGIVGLAEAARAATAALADDAARIATLRDRAVDAVLAADLGASLNGAGAARVPSIASIAFPGVPAEVLLHALEARGVFVSAGAACASRGHGPSHVLKAIGVADDAGTLRLSLAATTTAAEMDEAIPILLEEARALRGAGKPRARGA
jgi:cysteine desulfurase